MSTQPTPPSPSTEEILSQAAEGLLFTSETDAPLTPFFWADAGPEVSPESVSRAVSLPDGAQIEQQPVAEFLAPSMAEEDWQNEDERAQARRFQGLARVLRESLADASAFRVGLGDGGAEADVYIVGRAEGGLAGVRTRVVET